MPSAVQICNLALAHLGDEANVSSITPPEGSAQADHCAMFYPIARDALLEMHPWGFATRRANLAPLAGPAPQGWLYAYALPAGCLRLLRLRSPAAIFAEQGLRAPQRAANDNLAGDFTVESLPDGSRTVYSNVEDAIALYVAAVTDTAKFTPLFVGALARLLASYLAGPMIKGGEGMRVAQAHRQLFEQLELPQARAADAAMRRHSGYDGYVPSSLAAR